MTEHDFREQIIARVASLTTAVDMLKIEVRETTDQLWRRTDDRFRAMETATSAALAAADKANVTALTAAEKAVVKQELLAMARSAQQDDRISDLSTRAEQGTGRGEGQKATLYGAAAIIMALVAVVSLITQFAH